MTRVQRARELKLAKAVMIACGADGDGYDEYEDDLLGTLAAVRKVLVAPELGLCPMIHASAEMLGNAVNCWAGVCERSDEA